VVTVDHTRGNQVALRWLLYDGHGNLVRTMAPDYTLSAFQLRGVWGEVQGSLGTGRGYCANLGHPEDETGLVYMRARYYEPATGRFISEDPARDGVNWYLYADGNPIRYVDPDGQLFWTVGGLVVFLLGIAINLLARHYDWDFKWLIYARLALRLAGTAMMVKGVRDFLNRLHVVPRWKQYRKNIEEEIQQDIDQMKRSVGPGSLTYRMAGYMIEQAFHLFLIEWGEEHP
jgi:RHS repeat-associated protein